MLGSLREIGLRIRAIDLHVVQILIAYLHHVWRHCLWPFDIAHHGLDRTRPGWMRLHLAKLFVALSDHLIDKLGRLSLVLSLI